MLQQLALKIQLPSLFTSDKQIQMQVLGYKFDPINRLQQSQKQNKEYDQSNVGEVLKLIKEEYQNTLKIYQQKDWKNMVRPLEGFAFEIQIKVRVKNIKEPSIKVKSLQSKPRSNLYELLTLKTEAFPTQKDLTMQINELADLLIKKIAQSPKQISNQPVALAPQKLFNPHLFIKTAQKDKHVEYYTKGIYEYYHYGDQSFNDHGWGCAYRSLQSILSWFDLQNHCKIAKMFTLTQIQEIIDRINLSSDQKLKNSRQWIGATEVSWVVKKMTNYDCRILHIADGKDIMEHCQVLREHFEKVGCPVMYGGGQYAYSIVGLNYACQLGQCEFLILDPHYPGQDNIDNILQKKGLSWRKPDEMFKKGIFYNFCLPIVPQNE